MKTLFREFFYVSILCSLFITSAKAGDLTVEWVAPTACSDNSALTNCPTTGFEIWEGVTLTGTAYQLRETVASTITSKKYVNLPPGQRCYFLKTVSNATKSAESTRACGTIPSIIPGVPGSVTIRIEVTVNP